MQVLANCQQKLKPLVIEVGDIELVKKKKLTIVSFVESIHDISEGFLTYNDRQDITAHQFSVDVTELYSDHLPVHLNSSKERLLDEYQKMYEIKEMPTACVTRPQATDTSSVPPNSPPAASETFGERARRLFDKIASATDSHDNTTTEVATRPAAREQPPRPDTCIDAVL